ncbi:PKD domain-containing protein [Tundrisphaera sp. TA3]|uniref:PKD domain-containing protein n=1 Tax=Tundrisphaera sp. TA3 TaxID=3435775 RepID=UPI003EC0CBAA
MSRKRRRLADRRQTANLGRRLLFEPLERREMLAGGLAAQVIGASTVSLFGVNNPVKFTGATAADGQKLTNFFRAPDGQAGSSSIAGTMDVGGQSIQGTFTLSEFSATGGVRVVAAGASLQFGTTQGVTLSNADGAFALLPTGPAGAIRSAGSADSVGVVGLAGLNLTATAGLSFEVNQTGQAVGRTIPLANRDVVLAFADGSNVVDVAGNADFRVNGTSSTVARVGGSFRMTTADGGLSLAARQVGVDLYAGSTRAISLGSDSASFTLGAAGFAMAAGSFTAGSFALLPTGQPTPAGQGNYPATAVSKSASLGPISLQAVSPVLSGLAFGPGGLSIDVGLSAESASLAFKKDGAAGSAGAGAMNASAEGLAGSFRIRGTADGTGKITTFSAPGAFSLVADTFDLVVPKVLEASASGLAIGYDPALSGPQQIFAANSVSVTVPALNLQGEFTTSSSNPALVVRTDGFAFERGTVRNTSEAGVKVGSRITIVKPYVTLGNFSFSKSTGVSLGGFQVGAESFTVGNETSAIRAEGSDVSASIEFDAAGSVSNFALEAGSVTASVGTMVAFSASDVAFSPLAKDSDTVLALGTATATVSVQSAGLTLTGTAGGLTIGADATVTGPKTLSVGAAFDGSVGSKLKLPSYLPFQLRSVGVKWDDFRADPKRFLIDVSAGVKGNFGPVKLEGGVQSMVIDPGLLGDGKFPIVGLQGFSVAATGNLFGGKIEGAVIAGIIKLDVLSNILPDDAKNYTSAVFYGGIKAGFEFAGIGANIMVGFSEKGLLSAYLGADATVILDPQSGLALGNFHGGISFNATPLPVPTDPAELNAPIFQPTSKLDANQWEKMLRQQVVNQVSAGSRIFSIVLNAPKIVAELNSGSLAAGGFADDAFRQNNHTATDAADPAKVTVLTAGSLWMIEHSGSVFFVRRVDANTLDVSQARFKLGTVKADALGSGTNLRAVPAALVAEFAAKSIVLSSSAQIAQIQGGDAPAVWKVVDGSNTFFISTWGAGSSAALAVSGGGASFSQMNDVMRIEAGASLFDTYLSEKAFRADVDIILTTDGKFLIVGAMTLGDSVTADVKMFGDLSSIGQAYPNTPLKLLFLAQMPKPEDGRPALVTLKGVMTFSFRDAQGNLVNPLFVPASKLDSFEFNMLGQAVVGLPDTAALVLGGEAGVSGGYAQLKLTVKNSTQSTEVRLDLSGSLSIQGVIEAGDLVSAAGVLIFRKEAGKDLEVYGAAELNFDANSPGLSFLRDAGMSTAQADLLIVLNTAQFNRDVTLKLPGREAETFKIAPQTLEIQGTGTLIFGNSVLGFGATVAFVGAFAARISVDTPGGKPSADPTVRADGGVDIDLFVAGKLDVGLTISGQKFDLLDLDGQGLVAIRDIGAVHNGQKQLLPKIAARVDLAIRRDVPGVFQATGSVQLLLNTFGKDFTYVIPERLRDTIDTLNRLRNAPDASSISLPALNDDSITVPGAAVDLLTDKPLPAGPYFALRFGNPNHVDGMTDVKLTLLDTFELTGSFQVLAAAGAFQMTVDATAKIKIPYAGNILDSEVTGVLSFGPGGFFGGLGVQTKLTLPGNNIGFGADTVTYFGINTTSQKQRLNFTAGNFSSPEIAPRSGAIYAAGSLQLGELSVGGSFQLLVGAASISLAVDGQISIAKIPALTVSGTASIFYGLPSNWNGFVLDTALSLGNGGTIGVPGLFEVGGSLRLKIDTRPATYMVQIQVNNASVKVLNAFSLGGSVNIVFARDNATQQPYFSVAGNLSGNFLNVLTVSASGSFDSRGYIDLRMAGDLSLGTSDYGIFAGARFFIKRTPTVPLDFGGEAYGRVRAFGVTVGGVDVDIDYDGYGPGDGQTGEITAHARIEVLGVGKDVDFTIGYLVLDASAAPNLATFNPFSGALFLNVGALGSSRAYAPGKEDEAYTIESVGKGSLRGEMIQVSAFGVTQTFDNVMSIVADFGEGRDQLLIRSSYGTYRPDQAMPVYIKGQGRSRFFNESTRSVLFDASGSHEDSILQSEGAGSTLLGGRGADTLFAAGAGNTLAGNGGDDTIRWVAGSGTSSISGGEGNDTLIVDGSAGNDAFTLNGSGANLLVTANGETLSASGLEGLKLLGRGGADSVTVMAAAVAATGLASLDLDLSRFSAQAASATGGVETLIDDAAADSVTIVGTAQADTFDVGTTGGDISATWNRGGATSLTVLARRPGSSDRVVINAGDGADTFNVAGLVAGLALNGERDDDTFNLPIGGAVIDGGAGSNVANFLIGAGDFQFATLTAAQIYSAVNELVGSPSLLTALTNVKTVGIATAAASARIAVQSTIGTTNIVLASGGRATVQSTSGPLNIHLAGTASALLEATGSDLTTITAASGSGALATIGKGRLSQVGPVTTSGVDAVIFDNSNDGGGRTATLTSTSLALSGRSGAALSLSGAKSILYKGGLGNDTINVTSGAAAITVDGGAGADTLAVTTPGLPNGVAPVTAGAGIEAATFLSTATGRVDWTLDDGVLSSGAKTVLDVTAISGPASFTLGEGDGTTLRIARVNQATAIRLGSKANTVTIGGTLSTIDSVTRALAFSSAGAASPNNTLILDGSTTQLDRTRTIGGRAITGPSQPGAITYADGTFSVLNLLLGLGRNRVNLAGGQVATTLITGNSNEDTVIASGGLGNLTFRGLGGADRMEITPGTAAGTVRFEGGDLSDTLVVDASGATAALSGSLQAVGSFTTLALGTLTVNLDPADKVEKVELALGSGNDAFAINVPATHALPSFLLRGGAGDDAVTVTAAGGSPGAYVIDGESGTDTVQLKVAGTPTANLFAAINPRVETLAVDASANPATVAWSVDGSSLKANGLHITDSSGAGRVSFRGGRSSKDTLVVSGGDNRPINAVIDGSVITVSQGSVVLSQNPTSPASPPAFTGTVQGLDGAKSVASTPDGVLSFASGTDSTFAAFRRNPATGALAYIRSIALTEGSPTALAVSPDGKHLYVAGGPGNAPRLYIYAVDGDAGVADNPTSVAGFRTIGQVAISPDGKTVIAVEAGVTNGARNAYSFARDAANGALTSRVSTAIAAGAGRLSFSADSTQAFVPDSAGKVTVYQISPTAGLIAKLAVNNNADGLVIRAGTQVQASADGTLLLSYDPASQVLSYYRIPGDNDPLKFVKLGELVRVSGAKADTTTQSGRVFKYLDSLQVLIVLGFDGKIITSYKYDATAGRFYQVGQYHQDTLNIQSMDLASGPNGTLTYLLFSCPRNDSGSSEILGYAVNSAGFMTYEFRSTHQAGSIYRFTGPVAMVRYSPRDTYLSYIAAYSEAGQYGGYSLHDDGGNIVTMFNTEDDAVPLYMVAYREPVRGVSSDWIALEKSRDGTTTYLRTYNAQGGQYSRRFSYSLAGKLNDATRIQLSADGKTIFLMNGTGKVATIPAAYSLEDDYLSIDFAKIKVTNTEGVGLLSVSDVATANGRVYAVSSTETKLGIMTLSAAGEATVFNASTIINNGFNAYDLAGASAVVASADNSVLYVATSRGTLVTVSIDTTSGSIRHERTIQYAAAGGVNNGADIVRYGTNGDRLAIAAAGAGAIYLIGLNNGVPDGTPTSIGASNGLPLAGVADLSVSSSAIFAAASSSNAILAIPLSVSTLAATATSAVVQGQSYGLTISGLQAMAAAPGGNLVYAVSPADNAVAIYDLTTQLWTTFFNGLAGVTGLSGPALVAASQRGTTSYGYVLASGTLTIFTGKARSETKTLANFAGAKAIAVSADGKVLYVAGASRIFAYRLTRSGLLDSADPTASIGFAADLLRFHDGRLYAYGTPAGSSTKSLTSYASDLSGGFGLALPAGITGLAFAGTDIYASSSAASGVLYRLTAGSSSLTLAETYANGQGNAQGLDGASDVAVSGDGRYVFVAGKTGGTIAAYARSNGSLSFMQLLRDGRGANGIAQPTNLAVAGSVLIASSGSGRAGGPGGISLLDISESAVPTPTRYLTSFDAQISAVTVKGGSAADTIRVNLAPATTPLTIDTGDGGDVVNLFDLGGSGASTSVAFGSGTNELLVNQAVARTSGGKLNASGGAGADTFGIQNLAAGSAVTIIADQPGTAVDVIQVAGQGLASGSSVAVNGRLARNEASNSVSGPILLYNGDGATVTAGPVTKGQVTLSGRGTVTFKDMNHGTGIEQVFVSTPPRPSVVIAPEIPGNAIAEGGGIKLSASDGANLAGVTYAWDLDGDGLFNDAAGREVALTWAQLQALGIRTRGTYPIAVRATTTQNTQQFNGQVYQASADAAASLVLANTVPTITPPAGPAILGLAFTIPLSATDPGTDPVTSWTVDWGDKSGVTTYGSTAASAGHVYTAAGSYEITVTAIQGTISTTIRTTIVAQAGAGTLALEPGYTLKAGSTLAAAAIANAPASSYTWTIRRAGQVIKTLAPKTASLSVAWADLGIVAAGDYTLEVSGTYGSGTASASAPLTVLAVAPSGTLTASLASVPQGIIGGPIRLGITDRVDPAPGASPSLTVDYDFDNDGTIDAAGVQATAEVAIPDRFLATPGAKVVRAILRSSSGLDTILTISYEVTPVAPTLSLSSPTAILEGGIASITPTLAGPGVAVTSWRFDYGDGQSEVVANENLSFVQSHRYLNNQADGTPYTITVTATTNSGDVTATATVAVSDVRPTVAISQVGADVVEGEPGSLKLNVVVTDPGSDRVAAYTVDWGDGTVETFGGDVTAPTHTYSWTAFPAASFPVTITALTDNEGTYINAAGSLSNTLNVSVRNAAPTLVESLGAIPQAGPQGSPLEFEAVATSVATGSKPLTFAWTVTGPDGVEIALPGTPSVIEPVGPDFPVAVQTAVRNGNTFTPSVPGSYTIALIVDDGRGGSSRYAWAVEVADVAPTIDAFDVPTDGVAGLAIELAASASDVGGAADPITYTWTVTEQATGTTRTLSGASARFTPRGGRYIVRLVVADSFGLTTARSAPIDVINPGPAIAAGGLVVPSSGLQGGQATFRVAATDPGGDSDLAYAWKVLDPNGVATFLSGPTVDYAYSIPGTYAVSVTVTNPGGQSILASATVAVANVAPTIAATSVPGSGFEGVAIPLSATAADPGGAQDPLSYAWTLTDAFGAKTVLTGPSPRFVPADNGTYSVELVVTDAFGGSASQGLGTIVVANLAPTLGPIAVPAGAIGEGQSATFSVDPASDVAADRSSLRYDWTVTGPDGTTWSFPDQGRTLAFAFADDGSYTLTATATDKDGLASAASTATIRVANLDPTISAASIPTSGYVGFRADLSASAADVPADLAKLAYRWTITPPTGPAFDLSGPLASFVPTLAGTYAITLTVDDTDGGTRTRSGTLAVQASPITLAPLQAPDGSVEASAVSLSALATDDLGGTFSYEWTVTGPDGKAVAVSGTGADASFLPPDDGTYLVSVVARTPNGSASRSASVVVANLDPTLQRFIVPTSASIGVPVLLSAFATDPAGPADPLAYTWTITTPSGARFATLTGPQAAFTPTQPGTYGIRLTVDDGDGGVAEASQTLPVLNEPPIASAGGSYSVDEGGAVRLDALAGSSDPDQAASTLTYAWDFTGDGRFADAAGPNPIFSAAHLDGPTTVTVRVRVTDDQGAVSYDSATIQVRNVAPTIASLNLNATTINEGGSVSLSGTIADPGVADGHTVTVDWGDGSDPTQITLAAGVMGFTAPAHAYLDNPAGAASGGRYTIRVVVADKDGAISLASTRDVIVNNLAPTAAISGDSAGAIGQARSFTFSAADPSAIDAAAGFRLVVDWGDGTGETFADASSRTAAHAYASAGTFTVTLKATDKDGGVSVLATRTIAIARSTPTFTLSAPGSTYDGTPYRSAIGRAFGVGGASLGGATLTYYAGTDAALASPLAGAPTDAGSYQVVASFAGDGNHEAARSAPVAFMVAKRATTTSVAATPGAAGQAITLTATVATGLPGLSIPAGTLVQFKLNGANLGAPVPVNSNGVATLSASLPAGTNAVSATYAGDGNFLGSTAAPITPATYGPGAYAVGTTLLIVGANTSDYASINAAGPKSDGTTGLTIGATLNNAWISRTFNQAFTSITILGHDGNDNFQLGGNLTLSLTVAQGDGNSYIKAANGNDAFTFGAGSNQVFGGSGSKSVTARDAAGTSSYYQFGNGDHAFSLGQGNNQVFVGDGNNTVAMGDGNDTFVAGNGNNAVVMGHGNNYIKTGNGIDAIVVGDGNDNIQVGDGAKSIVAGHGNNYVRAGNGDVALTLGRGNDTVALGHGNNTISLGDGNNDLSSGNGNNTVTAGDGNNNIRLGHGDNVVVEGSGNNDVSAGNGANLVVGGLGKHTIRLGNGHNILIDGSATLAQPGDTFRKVLTDWKASGSTAVNARIRVTPNSKYPNGLMAGSGRNWFFYNAPNVSTTKKATDRLN